MGEYQLIHLSWVDSKGVTDEWEFLKDLEPLKPFTCTSIGYLLEETDKYITIA